MTEETTTLISKPSRKKPVHHKGNWNFTLLIRRLKEAEKKLREAGMAEEANLLRDTRTGIAHLLSMPVIVQDPRYPNLLECILSIDWPLLIKQHKEISNLVPQNMANAPSLCGVENLLNSMLGHSQWLRLHHRVRVDRFMASLQFQRR